MMTRQNLLLLSPPVKLPAARKTLSSILVIHPLHQVRNHPETWVFCLIQLVVLMIMWTKFAQIWTISCIPSIKFESTLTSPQLKKWWIRQWHPIWTNATAFYGINGYLVSQLQRCQNNAARIVSLRQKYDHITPVLKDLDWLPVEHRIHYKILLLAYKAQHDMAPPYLSSLLSSYKPGRSLWSEGKHIAWKVLASFVLRMPPLPSGTSSPSPRLILNHDWISLIPCKTTTTTTTTTTTNKPQSVIPPIFNTCTFLYCWNQLYMLPWYWIKISCQIYFDKSMYMHASCKKGDKHCACYASKNCVIFISMEVQCVFTPYIKTNIYTFACNKPLCRNCGWALWDNML